MANCEKILKSDKVTSKVRNERIDSVKYWLIVLVIAGHVLDRPYFKEIIECKLIWNWIFIFHMPLFVFISGYFSKKNNNKKFISSIWKLAEPLILFQTLLLITKYITKDVISINTIFTPWWVLWYLLSLIYWRVMIQYIPNKFFRNTKTILFLCFCLSIFAGFLPFNRFMSMQRTFAFMPFFFLGYYTKGHNIFLNKKYKPICIFFLILTFIISLSFSQYLGSLTHADPYSNIYDAIKRLVVFMFSIPISIAFVNACIHTKWIYKQGRATMQYYIFHALIIPPLTLIIEKLNIPPSLFTATACIILVLLLLIYLLKIKNIEKIINPSLFFK